MNLNEKRSAHKSGEDAARPIDRKNTKVVVEQVRGVAVLNLEEEAGWTDAHETNLPFLAALREQDAHALIEAIVVIVGSPDSPVASWLRYSEVLVRASKAREIIAALELCRKPVVAALQGFVLGEDLEVALGCDARVALAETFLGFVETALGLIPGAGGTQRLPRITGLPRAISILSSGERLPAEAARQLGLLDSVVTANLQETAVRSAIDLLGQKRRVRDRTVPSSDPADLAEASSIALRVGKNRPALHGLIDAIQAAARLPFEQGLIYEREIFERLRTSREAQALHYQSSAEHEAARLSRPAAPSHPIDRVAVIGAGTMGTGIAIAILDAGLPVALLEREQAALDRGVDRIRSHYNGRVKSGKMPAAQAQERQSRLTSGLDWSMVSRADLIIEAVFEDLAVKQEVFRHLDEVAHPQAILASNTSYLDLDRIAQVTSRPGQVVGLHFFSPANVMRLLEVVRGAATAPEVLASCLDFGKRLRKICVVSGNAFGFIGNRLYSAYRRQCEFMLEEGASPAQIDSALEAFGFAMGPFAVADMSGLDIAWRMRQSLAAARDPKARYVAIPDLLCEAGRLGQKTGAGYYAYAPREGQTGTTRRVDPAVDAIIDRARAAKGVTPRELGGEEITRRALLAMANEAALLLEEQVAERAGDIDVAMTNGYGFPRWEGGPVFWARKRSVTELNQDFNCLAGVSGPGFQRGDASYLHDPAEGKPQEAPSEETHG